MVVSRYDGIKTERRLSASRMRNLRRIIARGPCQKEIRGEPGSSYCAGVWVGYLTPGWQEVVLRHYPDRQSGPFPVYIPCDSTKGNDPRDNPIWQRFLSEVVGAIGDKSIIRCKGR